MTIRVPFAAPSVAVARQTLRNWMKEQGFGRHAVEDGRIVVSELIANSLRHAQPLSDGTILVTWSREPGCLLISVTDGGSESRPRALPASTSALSGRGMAIVDALAVQWWAERSRSRATIHALLADA